VKRGRVAALDQRRVWRVSDVSSTRAVALGLALGRIAIGAGIWIAPRRAFDLLGLTDSGRSPDGADLVVGRLAATRDLLLAVETLRALDNPARLRYASLAGAAADAADALAFGLALARREGIDEAAARGLIAAVPATLAGLWVAERLKSKSNRHRFLGLRHISR
jgi:hypothetical protein